MSGKNRKKREDTFACYGCSAELQGLKYDMTRMYHEHWQQVFQIECKSNFQRSCGTISVKLYLCLLSSQCESQIRCSPNLYLIRRIQLFRNSLLAAEIYSWSAIDSGLNKLTSTASRTCSGRYQYRSSQD